MLLGGLSLFFAALWFCQFLIPSSVHNGDELQHLVEHRRRQKVLLKGKKKRWSVEEFEREVKQGAKWTVCEGCVIDLSLFASHPGGDFLDRFIGRDCTPWILISHSKSPLALRKISSLTIGALREAEREGLLHEREREYLGMHEHFRKAGQFVNLHSWLVADIAEVMAPYFCGLWLWHECNSPGLGLFSLFISGCRTGFFFHDIGHHSVFRSAASEKRFNIACGLLFWGLDFHAPCAIHAVHHAFVNIVGLDTALEMGPIKVHPDQGKTHMGLGQNVLFYGLLIWLIFPYYILAGIMTSVRERDWTSLAIKVVRAFLLLYFGSFCMPLNLAAVLGFVYFAVTGSMNHFHKPMQSADATFAPGNYAAFVPIQTETVQNTDSNQATDWLLGHFTLHSEHHLFPHMPRRRYNDVSPAIVAFLAKWKLPYSVCTQADAVKSFNAILRNPF